MFDFETEKCEKYLLRTSNPRLAFSSKVSILAGSGCQNSPPTIHIALPLLVNCPDFYLAIKLGPRMTLAIWHGRNTLAQSTTNYP